MYIMRGEICISFVRGTMYVICEGNYVCHLLREICMSFVKGSMYVICERNYVCHLLGEIYMSFNL